MSQLITSMGELLIDFLPIQEGDRTVGFRMHPGGSLLNVAVGIARLKSPVAFASKVSTDMFGRFLHEYVEGQHIDTRFLLDAPAQSTLAFVSIIDGEPHYSFYTTQTADTVLTIDELPEAMFDETRILHFGSISLLRGTTPEAVLGTAERLRGRALLSFDPNIRTGLINDEQAYRATLDRALGLADIVKISAVDLQWFAPDQSLEAAAADLLSHGAALVVVTRGGEGVFALRSGDDQAIRLPSFKVEVVDTVGAGDSFSGGLLSSLGVRNVVSRAALEALSVSVLTDCIRFAAATSAITCTRAGADPPTRVEVEQFLADR
jgi:fructokinase